MNIFYFVEDFSIFFLLFFFVKIERRKFPFHLEKKNLHIISQYIVLMLHKKII